MTKVDFSNIDVSSKNYTTTSSSSTTSSAERKKKDIKSNKRIQIYLTADEERELFNRADEEHITLKQYILKKTIYA